MASTPTPAPSGEEPSGLSQRTIIIISTVIPLIFLVALGIFLCHINAMRNRKHLAEREARQEAEDSTPEPMPSWDRELCLTDIKVRPDDSIPRQAFSPGVAFQVAPVDMSRRNQQPSGSSRATYTPLDHAPSGGISMRPLVKSLGLSSPDNVSNSPTRPPRTHSLRPTSMAHVMSPYGRPTSSVYSIDDPLAMHPPNSPHAVPPLPMPWGPDGNEPLSLESVSPSPEPDDSFRPERTFGTVEVGKN
ncbi:hypothetical protein BS50DRAFT_584830 [Corynespora cassiicola Philippines]|uniref:Uncharacterized protein n=1 Tax=Corynespora cassiicola Philippines TaxID=1448308 RepID=A0A2T2P0Z7_CORCC|nr:hypothetical protein BS50DRAFT_584830 [Corynespora cassiicola Philippines]